MYLQQDWGRMFLFLCWCSNVISIYAPGYLKAGKAAGNFKLLHTSFYSCCFFLFWLNYVKYFVINILLQGAKQKKKHVWAKTVARRVTTFLRWIALSCRREEKVPGHVFSAPFVYFTFCKWTELSISLQLNTIILTSCTQSPASPPPFRCQNVCQEMKRCFLLRDGGEAMPLPWEIMNALVQIIMELKCNCSWCQRSGCWLGVTGLVSEKCSERSDFPRKTKHFLYYFINLLHT